MSDCIQYKTIERGMSGCAVFDDEAQAIVWFHNTRKRMPGDNEIYKLERNSFGAQYYIPLVVCDRCKMPSTRGVGQLCADCLPF